MSDDIVTRLRETEAYWKGTASHEDFVICGEAADEIERLRADRDRWRKTAEMLARELGKPEYAQAEYDNQGDL